MHAFQNLQNEKKHAEDALAALSQSNQILEDGKKQAEVKYGELSNSYQSLQTAHEQATHQMQQMTLQSENDRQHAQREYDRLHRSLLRSEQNNEQAQKAHAEKDYELNIFQNLITDMRTERAAMQNKIDDLEFQAVLYGCIPGDQNTGLPEFTDEDFKAAGIPEFDPQAIDVGGQDQARQPETSDEFFNALFNDQQGVTQDNPFNDPADGTSANTGFNIPGLNFNPLNNTDVPIAGEGESTAHYFDYDRLDYEQESGRFLQTMKTTRRNDTPLMTPYHGRPMRRPGARGLNTYSHQRGPQQEGPADPKTSAATQGGPKDTSNKKIDFSSAAFNFSNNGPAFPKPEEKRDFVDPKKVFVNPKEVFVDPKKVFVDPKEVFKAAPKQTDSCKAKSVSEGERDKSEGGSDYDSDDYAKAPDFESCDEDLTIQMIFLIPSTLPDLQMSQRRGS